MTNSSLVYGDVAFNANNAARAIYDYDVAVMNKQLNPPHPTWGWWSNVWRLWHVDFTLGLIVAVATLLGVYWQWRERQKTTYH